MGVGARRLRGTASVHIVTPGYIGSPFLYSRKGTFFLNFSCTLVILLIFNFFFFFQYLPQTYNYHPILSRDDEETGQGNPRDCAICMLPVDTSSTGPPGLNMLNRAQYMLTPCQHLFHTDCLEQVCWFNNIEIIQILVLLISLFQWMRIKLECPVCRSYLPVC